MTKPLLTIGIAVALVAGGAIFVLGSEDEPVERSSTGATRAIKEATAPTPSEPERTAKVSKIQRELERAENPTDEELYGEEEEPPEPQGYAAKSCNEPEPDNDAILLPNARLYYRDWEGSEAEPGSGHNRAAGCFYGNGRLTEFGFADVVEGETFGSAEGAGDFVAFTTVMWVAADGSDDGFMVWNLRNGTEVPAGPGCQSEISDCYISDIELTARGSSAYIACDGADSRCRVHLKRADEPTYVVAGGFKQRDTQPALLRRNGRLYWLNDKNELRSTPFT